MDKVNIKDLPSWDSFQKELRKHPDYARACKELEENMLFANQLIHARLSKGLTQVQLAKKAGMQQSAIARLENGGASPHFNTMSRIAKALDMKVAFV